MKRLIPAVTAVVLIFALCACGGDIPNTSGSTAGTPSPTEKSAQAASGAVSQEEDASEQDGLPYWGDFDFGANLNYAEEYGNRGDPGDYPTAAEAAKLTFDAMRDNGNIPEYGDDLRYTMTLVDLTDVSGEECYIYRLDADGSDTIGAAYAFAYQSGNIYMQGQGGQWVTPDAGLQS